MPIATSRKKAIHTSHVGDSPSHANDSLRLLHGELLKATTSAETKEALLRGLASVLDGHTELASMLYCERDPDGNLANPTRLRASENGHHAPIEAERVTNVCQQACRSGEVALEFQPALGIRVFAAPIPMRGGDPEVLGVVCPTSQPPSHVVLLLQIIVSQIVLWQVMQDERTYQENARDAAALVDLTERVATSADFRTACYTLAVELATFLDCQRIAIGWCSGRKGRCSLFAVSDVAQFDKGSAASQALEAVMEEALWRDEPTVWPITDDRPHATLAHKRLCSIEGRRAAMTTPLRNDSGKAVGAVVVLDDSTSKFATAEQFLRIGERSLASSLGVAHRLEGGRISRLGRAVANICRGWKGKFAVGAILTAMAAMFVPLSYKIACDCQIEPVTRRFVAAPFDGTLETSLVKPGDIVKKGDVIARIDGREVRWKRAAVDADRQQAIKRRDAAQASHSYGDQQIAQLEIERLDLELKLLDYRANNLQIKSPVDGIVTSGDLERAEGAPLTVGQTLFEIAPLAEMVVELSVPDDEISYLSPGQSIDMRLDAYPGHTWPADVLRIQPRSEIRDEENVFIAEAELENVDGRLRPGMKGRAKIKTPDRPLGWILFHRPWEYLTKQVSW